MTNQPVQPWSDFHQVVDSITAGMKKIDAPLTEAQLIVLASQLAGWLQRVANQKSRHNIAHCVALLQDGPLTVDGAAEMLDLNRDTVSGYFRVLKEAGVAETKAKRAGRNGKPARIWSMVEAA